MCHSGLSRSLKVTLSPYICKAVGHWHTHPRGHVGACLTTLGWGLWVAVHKFLRPHLAQLQGATFPDFPIPTDKVMLLNCLSTPKCAQLQIGHHWDPENLAERPHPLSQNAGQERKEAEGRHLPEVHPRHPKQRGPGNQGREPESAWWWFEERREKVRTRVRQGQRSRPDPRDTGSPKITVLPEAPSYLPNRKNQKCDAVPLGCPCTLRSETWSSEVLPLSPQLPQWLSGEILNTPQLSWGPSQPGPLLSSQEGEEGLGESWFTYMYENLWPVFFFHHLLGPHSALA